MLLHGLLALPSLVRAFLNVYLNAVLRKQVKLFLPGHAAWESGLLSLKVGSVLLSLSLDHFFVHGLGRRFVAVKLVFLQFELVQVRRVVQDRLRLFDDGGAPALGC